MVKSCHAGADRLPSLRPPSSPSQLSHQRRPVRWESAYVLLFISCNGFFIAIIPKNSRSPSSAPMALCDLTPHSPLLLPLLTGIRHTGLPLLSKGAGGPYLRAFALGVLATWEPLLPNPYFRHSPALQDFEGISSPH